MNVYSFIIFYHHYYLTSIIKKHSSTLERQMKILDELHAYQGQLSFDELNEKVDQIILCSNLSISGYRTK